MAYDEKLAALVRSALAARKVFEERRMFGGLAFLVRGSMCCGIDGSDLMVRVGHERHEAALATPHAREMDFTGRPSRGMVFVGPQGVASADALNHWLDLALGAPPPDPRHGRAAATRIRRS
jgi:hypothetical protein